MNKNDKQKIAIFGGAFDPPHMGHINLVKSVVNQLKCDKILIIPTGNPPHKETMSSFALRFELAKAAFANVPNCEISDIENTPEYSYTADTLKKLHQTYPDSEFTLIIGSDMVEKFHKWVRYEQVLEQCSVVAVARAGSASDYDEPAKRHGIRMLDIPVIEMSSSEIREHFITLERYTHSINVAIMCYELSKAHGFSPEQSEKAYLAGLLHDIVKEKPNEELEAIVHKNHKSGTHICEPVEYVSPKLWHAIAGAVYVREKFGITDEEIISSIRFHTIAKPHMSKFEQVVYLADKISADREYEGIEELRKLCFSDLDLAMANALKRKVKKKQKLCIDMPSYTTDAYEHYKRAAKARNLLKKCSVTPQGKPCPPLASLERTDAERRGITPELSIKVRS
ncbi:MAG: nicotinate (nicotinamide) nucleotide adenylyltransferase [Oscillospiraceae bacterium]|nr:nicotinate (nicotinamide) nucleotide adenylyltransferase [Oscillospiraceae bacterium]